MWQICRDKAVGTDDQGLLAMQKVEGSSPFSRSRDVPGIGRLRAFHLTADRTPGVEGGAKASASVPPIAYLEREGRPLTSPRFETTKGTTKFSAHFTQVAAVASPRRITSSWLIAVSSSPTTSAIRSVRRRYSGRRQ
jgi:hypothetical protein